MKFLRTILIYVNYINEFDKRTYNNLLEIEEYIHGDIREEIIRKNNSANGIFKYRAADWTH